MKILDIFFYINNKINSSYFINKIINNTICNDHPILKIIILLFFLNIIYKIFFSFILIILKGLFPIFYIIGLLYLMDNYTKDRPFNSFFNNIKNNNYYKEEELDDLINKSIKNKKNIIKEIPEIKIIKKL